MGCSCIPRAGREGPETPLPKFRVFVLLCITVSEGFSLNMLFPFVSYMVRSFGYTSAADTSFYAAFVGSAFGFAQFLGSFYWGVLSDRYGRRPVLLLGLIGSAFSMVLFGFSTSLSMAIASRALNGLLNGNSGVAKTYMREITDATNQARAFALFGTAWGVGSILGPTAGGFLSYPADKFPSLVPAGSLLDVHPFLLPCLVSASVNVMGLVVGWILLKETLPNPSRPWWWRRIARACLRTCSQRGRPSSSARAPRAPSQGTSVRHVELVAVDSDDSGDEANGAGRGARSDKPSARVQRRGPTTTGYTVVGHQRLGSSDEEGEGNALNGGVRADKPAHSLPRDTAELPPELLTPAVAPKSTYTVFCEVVRTPSVLLILGMNSTLAFIVVCLQELFPLWASSSISDGGLAFRPDDIGAILGFSGMVLIPYSIFVLPVVERCMGARKMVLRFTMLYLPVCVLTPMARAFVSCHACVWALLCSIYFIRATAGPSLFAASALLANNASAKNVGAVNGLLTSCMALVRAVGPAIGGTVLSWSQGNGLPWPFDYHFVFNVMGVLLLGLVFMAYVLPTNADIREEDRVSGEDGLANPVVESHTGMASGVDTDVDEQPRGQHRNGGASAAVV